MNVSLVTEDVVTEGFRHTFNNRVAMGCLLSLIDVITIIGNCFVLLSICSCRHLRTISNLFIGNLALVDFIIGICTMPITVATLGINEWKLGTIGCLITATIDNMAICCSLWTLAASALDRAFAILSPFKYNRLMNNTKSRMLIGSVWLISLMLAICPVIGWDSYVYSWFSFSCGINPKAQGIHRYFFLFYTVFALIVPLAIVTACYVPIFIVAHRANKIHATQTTSRHAKRHLQAALLVIVIVGVFAVTTLPVMTIGMLSWTGILDYIPLNLAMAFHIMLYSNSAINPILYGVFNSSFREVYKSMIRCEWGKKRHSLLARRRASSLREEADRAMDRRGSRLTDMHNKEPMHHTHLDKVVENYNT